MVGLDEQVKENLSSFINVGSGYLIIVQKFPVICIVKESSCYLLIGYLKRKKIYFKY